MSLQATEDQRKTKAFGQPAQFLVENVKLLLGDGGLSRANSLARHGFALGTLAAFTLTKGCQCQTASDRVQPCRQSGSTTEASRLTRQGQERCLKHILGEMFVAHKPASGAEDHRPMPVHEESEGRLVALLGESAKQRFIRGRLGSLSVYPMANVGKHRGCRWSRGHVRVLRRKPFPKRRRSPTNRTVNIWLFAIRA